MYLHLSCWTVLWVRWCKISITIAPSKRIRTTCMLKPKTHPHLCDNSEQHESKGGNAYVFLFVFSACAFWWDLSVSHATRNTLISMFLVTLWRRAGAQKWTLSCKLIVSAAACRAHLATYRIHSAVKNVIPKIQVPRVFLKCAKHQSSSAVGSSMTPAAKCVLFRRPLPKICIWAVQLIWELIFSP